MAAENRDEKRIAGAPVDAGRPTTKLRETRLLVSRADHLRWTLRFLLGLLAFDALEDLFAMHRDFSRSVDPKTHLVPLYT
jgi:hypothetical protein